MDSRLVLLGLALVAGVSAGLQGPLAGVLGRHVGIVGSVFLVHLGGTLAAGALLAGQLHRLGGLGATPWYALGAGLLGLPLIGALAICIPRLGAAQTLTVVILGQLVMAVTIDHFGVMVDQARAFDSSRLLGGALLLAGTWLVMR
jgi:transporter family-2 protein